MLAYVLFKVELGAEGEVLKVLENTPQVKEAYIIYGIYDIVAKVEFEKVLDLGDLVLSLRRKCKEKIKDTVTMIVAKGFSR
ncbi:MAG: Lrp/AsnC family transcriptional regulator [Thermoprotei archaeon]|nr:MAG: Lrp/AsnC family transcriptional regulator [Thermoprotei archaeon]